MRTIKPLGGTPREQLEAQQLVSVLKAARAPLRQVLMAVQKATRVDDRWVNEPAKALVEALRASQVELEKVITAADHFARSGQTGELTLALFLDDLEQVTRRLATSLPIRRQ